MFFRTDLALEIQEAEQGKLDGVVSKEIRQGDVTITSIDITSPHGVKIMGKPMGRYITVELPPLTDNAPNKEEWRQIITAEIHKLLPPSGLILVCGLGNEEITPDALGPQAASRILATRHIAQELEQALGSSGLRSVAVLAPGVLGQTGVEVVELMEGVVKQLKPSALIVIDALASRRLNRLGCTVQIGNTGISPGSGVANARPALDEKTLGVPVIAVGVPTVVDAATLAADLLEPKDEKAWHQVKDFVSPRGESMMVTPREIDLLIDRAAALTALSINCALQEELSAEDILALMA